MVSLKDVVSGAATKSPRVLAYGPPGVGKTTFGASAPKPIFIQTEDGADIVGADRLPRPETYSDVEAQLEMIIKEDHDYSTLVIDSLDWLEPLVYRHVCETHKWKHIEDPGYGKGYQIAGDVWRRFVSGVNAVRDQKNMIIIILAHSQVKRFEDPDSEPYDRYEIKTHKNASAVMMEHCDLIGFCTYQTTVKETDTGFGRKRTRAMSTGERVIKTQAAPAFIAKSRYPIPAELPLDWNALEAAIFSKE